MPEWADAYVQPGTGVLANKPGIRDEAVLKTFEYEQSALRIAQLRERPIQGKFDLAHLQQIHAHVFQDVYDWAGQTRTVNLAKGGTSFTKVEQIAGDAQRISQSLASENHLQGLNKPQFVDRLAHYYARYNALHPFREGNGRSTREFIGQLARHAGYELDQTRIDNGKEQWNEAAKRSAAGDLSSVKEIFAHAIRPSRALAFDKLPEREAVAKHPELREVYEVLRANDARLASQYPGNDQAQQRFREQARSEWVRKLDVGHVPPRAIERAPATAAPTQQSAIAKAFQAVADNAMSRDDALKLYPALRHSFNQLAIARVEHAGNPQQVAVVRESLQRELNAGRVPQPQRANERTQQFALQR